MSESAVVFDLSDLLEAHKRVLSQEYNVSADLPDEEFFSIIENIGVQKIKKLKDQGAKFVPHADMSEVLMLLESTIE